MSIDPIVMILIERIAVSAENIAGDLQRRNHLLEEHSPQAMGESGSTELTVRVPTMEREAIAGATQALQTLVDVAKRYAASLDAFAALGADHRLNEELLCQAAYTLARALTPWVRP
jgi:hypothetical protein